MKRYAVILLALAAALLTALFASPSANAISRGEDIIRDLNEVFQAPSAFPPNNALRPNPEGPYGNGNRAIVPLGPDEGPGPEDMPERVPREAYPFVVALIGNYKTSPQEAYVCAGALISPTWVLTAAHCTFNWTRRWPLDADPHVLTDTSRLAEPGPRYRVLQIVTNPDYDARTLMNDLALVRIDTAGANPGPPIGLEGPPITQQVGEIAHILGWGVSNVTLADRRKTESLQLIQAMVRGDLCYSPANNPKLRGKGVFCASSLNRYHDTCYRFGGSPVVLRDGKGRPYLAGVVSWSTVCPQETYKPNVYLDVQHYLPWIESVVKDLRGAER